MASGYRRGTEECAVPPLETGIQAIQLSPYRAGVAGRSRTRLRAAPAFHPCSCSFLLSDSGKVVASKSLTLNFGHLRWQFTRCAPRRTLSPHTAQHFPINFRLRSVTISAEYLEIFSSVCIRRILEFCAPYNVIHLYFIWSEGVLTHGAHGPVAEKSCFA
jgi:hypothetical protein